jgi:hypothetical protein
VYKTINFGNGLAGNSFVPTKPLGETPIQVGKRKM